jgi:natural product precursor
MMKKLGKLKLNALNEQDLAEKQMNALRGGNPTVWDTILAAWCLTPWGTLYYNGNYAGSGFIDISTGYYQMHIIEQYMYSF